MKDTSYTIQYLQDIATYFKDEMSSEMSYRSDFQKLLGFIFPKEEHYHIQHDPRATGGNKPDFIILKNEVPILYIEVKKVGENLDKIEKSAQASRYFGYTNLIITDYLSFRFYRNGEPYEEEISLGKPNLKDKEIIYHTENQERLINTILDFTHSNKEPIRSGRHLAKIMGGRAQRIRDNTISFMTSESADNDELKKIMAVIKDHLVADIDIPKFADMYAQTLVYGLFVARYNDGTPEGFSRQEARDLVPATNPFLRHFFDHIAGNNFPKRLDNIVRELCEVFTHADVHKLLTDYYKKDQRTETKDPIIHFYEDFLREYDPNKKMEMGVFYTPLPVVQFIIRSIDTVLKKEFGIEKGLADKQKILKEQSEINAKGKKVKVQKEYHKVQILDVATGTGTFLNEVINHIHKSFIGHEGTWPSYVESDLIPRLHGFELMMASYTIAHLKLAMTLQNSGMQEIKKRLGVYLTNTLEEPSDYSTQGTLFGFMDSIADESKSASRIKKEYPIMVVIGNPPYSGESMNPQYKDNLVYKVEIGGKQKLKERNSKWLNDDYVKFIRFAETLIEKNQEGIVGMITSHGYIDNPTFRGMRWHLRKTFDAIYVLDLHGNLNKKEVSADGSKDENVFDIKTGVSIFLGIKKAGSKNKDLATIYHADIHGIREQKFSSLNENDIATLEWTQLPENIDAWQLEGEGKDEYRKGFSINDLFIQSSVGIITARDNMSIQWTKTDIERVINDFQELDESILRTKYNLGKDARDWKVLLAKKDVIENFTEEKIVQISYRPFDTRWTLYTGVSRGFHCMPRVKVMKNMLSENIAMVILRQVKAGENFQHIFVSKYVVESTLISNKTSEIDYVLPLYIYDNDGRVANLNKEIISNLEKITGATNPEDIFNYTYAILHSPSYRKRYQQFLKSDFPRVPYPKSKEEFWDLVPLGTKLRELHLLNDPILKNPITTYPITGINEVERVIYENGKVHINDTQYFGDVPEIAWNFYIGGYQPAQKYLKDRKGKILSTENIETYEKIIIALTETERIMKEIDKVLKV